MTLMTNATAQSFLNTIKSFSHSPEGIIVRETAPKIQTRFGESCGNMKQRLHVDALSDQRYKIAAIPVRQHPPFFSNYKSAEVHISNQDAFVWINIRSASKRFDLPEDVILRNLSNFNRIVRLILEKQLFQKPFEDMLPTDDVGNESVPLLPPENIFTSLIPLEQIAQMAQKNNCCYHLSKRCYNIAKSIDIWPGGFIAFVDGKRIGEGRNATVRASETRDGTSMARRSYKYNLLDPDEDKNASIIIPIFHEFKNNTGIFATQALGVYENKFGKCKLVSFHPLYETHFQSDIKYSLSVTQRYKMAHQLLQGLNTIAEKGLHRDLSFKNILIKTTDPVEAVIGDTENFQSHDANNDTILNPSYGPEKRGTKREVWDMGKVLYHLFSTEVKHLFWNDARSFFNFTNDTLDQIIEEGSFSQSEEALLRGMLAADPNQRWTANQALNYFEINLIKKG